MAETFIILQMISVSKKICSFESSIHERFQKNASVVLTTGSLHTVLQRKLILSKTLQKKTQQKELITNERSEQPLDFI